MNIFKKNLIYSLVLTLMISLTITALPKDTSAAQLGLAAESAILVEADSGKVLYELNADLLLPPASMTKMMSEYLVLEAIKTGKIGWDTEFQISEFVVRISQNRNLSNVPLRIDSKYTVRELYEAMAIYSANGATIALAELIAGSETEFVKMMNNKAKELNLQDYKFVNSTGLNNSDLLGNHPEGTGAEEENMLSARATAKLAYHLITDYPEVLETASIPKKTFREGTKDSVEMPNWNWMLPGMEGYLKAFSYEGMDGIKTGSTELAGSCFTGTAERDGMRLISVVMRTDSREARFRETEKLMNYGFGNFEEKEIIPQGYQVENNQQLPVVKGKEDFVSIATNSPISIVVKKDEEELYEPVVTFDQSNLNEDGALTAPVKEGQVVGSLSLNYKGEAAYGYLTQNGPEQEVTEVVTTGEVEKANWFSLFLRSIGSFFSDVWGSVADTVKGWM